MIRFILLAMAMIGCSCGPNTINLRTDRPIKWTLIDTATIHISSSNNMYAVSPINTNIQWTEPERGTFTLDCSGLVSNDTDPDLLELGTCFVDNLRVNKLKVCGVGGTTKCTDALIRMYTTGAHAGFINTTEGYGVPFLSDGQVVGLTDANALSLSTYTIPANRRRIHKSNFNDTSYDLSIDMENAGVGDYEVDITVELLLGI